MGLVTFNVKLLDFFRTEFRDITNKAFKFEEVLLEVNRESGSPAASNESALGFRDIGDGDRLSKSWTVVLPPPASMIATEETLHRSAEGLAVAFSSASVGAAPTFAPECNGIILKIGCKIQKQGGEVVTRLEHADMTRPTQVRLAIANRC